MNKTTIPWVKNPDGTQGYSWNPITGCLNGCEYCYARKLANTRLKLIYTRNFEIALPHENPKVAFDDPFYPRFWENRLIADTVNLKTPKGVFVCDMSDLFGIGIPDKWIQRVMFTIERNPQHRFYLLTKQPQNMVKYSPFPDNCWVGVSVTSALDCIIRLPKLATVSARVKFVSFEPLLKPISSTNQLYIQLKLSDINWLIIGSQTKPVVHPKREWVEEILEAADTASIPVFIKEPLASHLNIHRQEMPNE